MFWYSENSEGKIHSAAGLFEGVFSFFANETADLEEIILFSKIMGAKTLVLEKSAADKMNIQGDDAFIMKLREPASSYDLCRDITGENLKATFSVIFEDDPTRDSYFAAWYTDLCHRLRHGLAHGKGIWQGESCLCAAFTSGETERLCVISAVACLNEHRGQGFGRQVTLALAHELEGREVYLLAPNKRLAAWYESMGFFFTGNYIVTAHI